MNILKVGMVQQSCGDDIQANIEKLKRRYPEGFSCEKSRTRLKGDL